MADTLLGSFFFSFFALLLIIAVICIVRPSIVERVRSRGRSDSSWLGGWFYATPWRTRWTGAALLVIAMLGLGHLR